jgi:carboxymethylenebutenolidase
MCYDDDAQPPLPPGTPGPANGQDLVLTASDGNQFAAYLALPEGQAHARVVVLPDIRGLHRFYKDLAMRFAEVGVAAISWDYFGRTAGLTARDDSFEFMPHVQQLSLPGIFGDQRAALDQLRQNTAAELPTFVLGFCLGGSLSFISGTQDFDLAGVVGFYSGMSRNFGGAGTLLDLTPSIKVPALGLFGGDDPGIPQEQVETFDKLLDDAGVPHAVKIYPGAPHSFFDRRFAQFEQESADAWQRVLSFFAAPKQVSS